MTYAMITSFISRINAHVNHISWPLDQTYVSISQRTVVYIILLLKTESFGDFST